MDLVLIGTGRMGQTVERVSASRGHAIVARFDSEAPFRRARRSDLSEGAVAIDFSLPSLAIDHIRHAVSLGIPIVVGTTGWHDRLDDVRSIVNDDPQASVLHAANFSLGVALLRRAVGAIGKLVDRLDEYDVAVHEAHHTGKVDSPSGTAHLLANDLLGMVSRKSRIETETVHGRIDEAALHVTSARVGRVFGRHTVTIDSDVDEVTLQHSAKSRDGFALGAVRSAEWLQSRNGLFTLDDVIDEWLQASP